jgi:CBS domain-containing protein
MKGIAHVLRGKPGKVVHAIGPRDTVYDAIKKMAEQGIGALLVMEGEKIVGIVTERDYARKIALAGRSSKETPVSVIMTTQVLCVGPPDDECGGTDREPRAPFAGSRRRQADRAGF